MRLPAKEAVDGIGGPVDLSKTPYARGPLDAYGRADVDKISLMFGTQIGKTLLGMFCPMGYTADVDPAPTMYVGPDEDTAKKVFRERIVPIFKASPALKAQMSGLSDDEKGITLRMKRNNLYIAWARSPAALASFPVRNVFLDEVDKYPKFSGKEATPTKLAAERTKNFWNRKIVQCSTPTTRDGYIFREFEISNKQRYYVPCPHCGTWDLLTWKNVKFPKEERNHERIRTMKLAWYMCPHCEGRIDDRMKNDMVARGVWCPDVCEVEWNADNTAGVVVGDWPQTSHFGYHLNSLYSPWVTFSMAAAEFVEAETQNDNSKRMNFVNSWLAEIFEEIVDDVKSEMLIELVSDFEEMQPPSWAQALFAGADVQIDRLYTTVHAWGSNERVATIYAPMLSGGTFGMLEDVILNRVFLRQGDGRPMQVRALGIDRKYRGGEVDKFCRPLQGRAFGVIGLEEQQAAPYVARKIDRDPDDGKFLEGGLMYWSIDTMRYKDWKSRLMAAREPQQWFLHNEIDGRYCDETTAEHKIMDRTRAKPRMAWVPRPGHPQNHRGDCDVYAMAMAEMHGANFLTDEVNIGAAIGYASAPGGQIGR